MRRCSRSLAALAPLLLACASGALGCAQATQTYTLELPARNEARHELAGGDAQKTLARLEGSLSVELIEGGQRLVVLQLDQLPPPERIAPGLREFVVWLKDLRGGQEVKVGTLHYDRAHHSGNLLATTALRAFTVSVTGERDSRTTEPTGVLLAERRVVTN
jgi:hypothetical protein